MRSILIPLLAGLLAVPALASENVKSIAGVRLGMSASKARQQLTKCGTMTRTDRKRQEVWSTACDKKYSAVIVSFDGEDHVRFVTGIAREGAVRYRDAIDIKDAKSVKEGAFVRYDLTRVSRDGEGTLLQVRGSDKEYAHYVSLKRVSADGASAENEEEEDD